MITKFKKGTWYIYKGKHRGAGWNSEGHMDFVLDGKPHLCIYTPYNTHAKFDRKNENERGSWIWHPSDLKLFEEFSGKIDSWKKKMEGLL